MAGECVGCHVNTDYKNFGKWMCYYCFKMEYAKRIKYKFWTIDWWDIHFPSISRWWKTK